VRAYNHLLSLITFTALIAGCSADARPTRLGNGGDTNSAGGGGVVLGGGGGGNGSIFANGGVAGVPDVQNGECAQVTFQTDRRPTEVLLLLDRSGSMVDHEISPGVTRWVGVVNGVKPAVTAVDSKVDWGMKTFPESTGNECLPSSVTPAIDVQIAPLNAAAVNAAIDTTQPTGDGTPTGDAVMQAAAYLASRQNNNQKIILLATDGQPSCADLNSASPKDSTRARDWAVQQVTAAATAGFPTFVLGVLDPAPSSSTLDTLNRMARAGGRPAGGGTNPLANAFYLATNTDELTQALGAITGSIASCEFPFDTAPPDPTNIAVKVNGQRVPEDPALAEGWAYTDATHRGVKVYGTWCAQIQALADNQIDFIFGCPGQPIH
jgi:hypothetical protein